MTEPTTDTIVEFNPADWKPDRDTDTGEEILSGANAIETAARLLSEKGIEIQSIWHAHDSAIEYAGKREYIGLGVSFCSAADALMEAMREIAYAIDAQDGIECYISSIRGKHFFHIRNTEREVA